MILSEVEFRKGYLVLNIKKEEKIIQEFTFESFFFFNWKSSRKFRPKCPRPVHGILAALVY